MSESVTHSETPPGVAPTGPLCITLRELQTYGACDYARRVAALERHLGRVVGLDEPVPLLTWADVTVSTIDLIWALRCCWWRGGREVGVEVACRAAERVVDLHARPRDIPALRAAIDAARGHVAGTVRLDVLIKAGDAAAACAASYAATTAASYAAAACAASYAATTAASYAAAAARAAARAADYGARTDDTDSRADLIALLSAVEAPRG